MKKGRRGLRERGRGGEEEEGEKRRGVKRRGGERSGKRKEGREGRGGKAREGWGENPIFLCALDTIIQCISSCFKKPGYKPMQRWKPFYSRVLQKKAMLKSSPLSKYYTQGT